MAVNGKTSMISPPSSVSNGPEPSQLPPYPPPLRSGQVLQPLSVFTGMHPIKICNQFQKKTPAKRKTGRSDTVQCDFIYAIFIFVNFSFCACESNWQFYHLLKFNFGY